MITPYEDKFAIKAIIDTDPYIQRAGFKPENIKMSKYATDTLNTASNDLRIFIYNGAPINSGSWNQRAVVYNITVVGKRDGSTKVDNVVQQIMALLTETNIGRSHILYLLDAPMELDSNPAIYSVEMSFVVYEAVFNKVKS